MNRKTRRSRIRAIPGEDDAHPRHDEEAARLEKSLADLPGVAAAYENYKRVRGPRWGSEGTLRAYEAFNEVLWPYLERLLMDGGPEDELQGAFDFVERVASSSEFARGIVATELGWELWARRHSTPSAELSRAAERYLGPKTAMVFASQEALVRSIDGRRWSNRLLRWLRSRVTPKDPKSSA